MDKKFVKNLMKKNLIAVIRNSNLEEAKKICKTVLESGIKFLEITFTVPDAEKLILELKRESIDAVIGAGTVFNEQQADLAINNGADFIVSPCVIREIGDYCGRKNIFCSMGAFTPTEVYNSYLAGSDVVKLFPGDCVNMKMISGIKAPMPFVDLMPTGGVDDTNVNQWFESGAYSVGIGGYLTKGINGSNLDLLRERCRKITQAIDLK